MQPHCSYRIPTADPPLFDWPSITVNVQSRSVTPSHLMGWSFITSRGVSHQMTHFYILWFWSMSVTLTGQNGSRSFCGYFGKLSRRPVSWAKPFPICWPTNIHTFAWNMANTQTHTHAHKDKCTCTLNYDFDDDFTFDSILQDTGTQNCWNKHQIPVFLPSCMPFLCVSVSGEWHSGRQYRTPLLITSSRAEITAANTHTWYVHRSIQCG